jgi:hypothetical protein
VCSSDLVHTGFVWASAGAAAAQTNTIDAINFFIIRPSAPRHFGQRAGCAAGGMRQQVQASAIGPYRLPPAISVSGIAHFSRLDSEIGSCTNDIGVLRF